MQNGKSSTPAAIRQTGGHRCWRMCVAAGDLAAISEGNIGDLTVAKAGNIPAVLDDAAATSSLSSRYICALRRRSCASWRLRRADTGD
jgi:hypothetical protein